MILQLRSAIALLTCWCLLTTVSAAAANIGLVITNGDVQVDGMSVPGSAVIFSGSRIATGDGITNLRFSDGTSALMRPGTQMTVYREHSVLLQGVTMQRGLDRHPIIANGLRISGATPNAAVLVGVKDESHFDVAAQGGDLEVRTSKGNLVARVIPGRDLSFIISQAPAGTPQNEVQLCGRLGDNNLLSDFYTTVDYQLQGTELERFHGKTVEVSGLVVNPSATPNVVNVSSIRNVKTCAVAAAPGAAPAAARIASGVGLLLIALALAGLGVGIYYAVTSQGAPPATPIVP